MLSAFFIFLLSSWMHKFRGYNGTQKCQDALKEEKVCQLHRKNNYLVSKKILQLLLTTLKVLKDQAKAI